MYRDLRRLVSFLILISIAAGCSGPEKRVDSLIEEETGEGETINPKLIIRAPTADEAFDYLMLTADNMAVIRKFGLKHHFPEHPAFQALLDRTEPLSDEEKVELRRIFKEEVHDPAVFAPAVETVEKLRGTIEAALARLQVLNRSWGFDVWPEVEVIFNLYPSLGGWHPLNGKINMCMWDDGSIRCAFGEVGAVEIVVVHEIVHTGIELPVVEKFGLSFVERERLVDLICIEYLGDLFPVPYPLQVKGDKRLDTTFVDREAIVTDLPAAIERYVAAHPRTEKDFNIFWWKKYDW